MSQIEINLGGFADNHLNNLPEETQSALADLYNRKFNARVKPQYDGKFQTFPDLQLAPLGIEKPYDSQYDTVWMLKSNDGGIVDHEVGAGKTLTICITAHEMKRLKMAHKPMIIGLKTNIFAIAETYAKVYPKDKILYPTERDFEPKMSEDVFSDRRHSEAQDIIESLTASIFKDERCAHLHPYIEDWIENDQNIETIRFEIYDRDTSDPIKEMVDRTILRSRATLFTNYDCLSHNFDMGNTYSYEDYFKDIVDVLHLNPALVKKIFKEKGIHTKGRFPNKPKRDGKEAVRYEELADEMLNQCSYGLLTFMGYFPLTTMYENNFKEYKGLCIPKGNLCGMFNSWNGGGSLMEMELLRDLYIPVQRRSKTEYDRFSICVDERKCGNDYSIEEVYGLTFSAWRKEIQVIY